MDEIDRKIVMATQAGLPIVAQPYHAIASDLGLRPAEVMPRIERMHKAGVIRRIGVVPNHYALGLGANGMSVWDLDDASAVELGRKVGALDFVSHCYRRPRLPGWPYNLFVMVHGKTQDEVDRKIDQVRGLVGSGYRDHTALKSTKILKKTGLRLRSAEK